MPNKHMERGSTSLVIREMRIKMTMKCHNISTMMTKKTILNVNKDVEQMELSHTPERSINLYKYFRQLFGRVC